jgi:putative transposase
MSERFAQVPEALWNLISHLIPRESPKPLGGRPRVPDRVVLAGILYRLRTGCQWKALPSQFGSGSTCHRRFSEWTASGLFERIMQAVLEHYDAEVQIDWEWCSMDSATVKAPKGGDDTGPNPTDRAKSGTKRHILTDRRGVPLAVTVSGANVHDMRMALPTLDAARRYSPGPRFRPINLCLDKGYDNQHSRAVIKQQGYLGHIRRIGEQALDQQGVPKHPARRYVVERTISWLSKCRGLLVRYERKSENYLAQLQFACALLWYRRLPDPATVFS